MLLPLEAILVGASLLQNSDSPFFLLIRNFDAVLLKKMGTDTDQIEAAKKNCPEVV